MVIRDIKGKLIVFLICAIIWYSEVLQYGYLKIPNILLILGIFMGFVILSDYSSKRKKSLVGISSEIKILGFYLITTLIIGCIMAPNLGSHITHGISCIEYYCVALAVYYYAVTRKNISFLAWNYLILYSIFVVVFIRSPKVVYEGTQIRYSLTSSLNVNSFAMGLTMTIWAIMYLISLKRINTVIGFLLIGIDLYSIVLTSSRKGLIGALLCIVLWVFLCYLPINEDKRKLKRYLKYIVIFVVAIAFILIIVPIYIDSYMADRMRSLSGQLDPSTLSRIKMYKSGLEYIKDSPIFGHGFWGFSYYYGVYSHSSIIEVPVSSGIPLATLFLYSILITARKLIRNRNELRIVNTNNHYELQVSTSMSMVLFLLMCFYSFVIIHIYEISSYIVFAIIFSVNDIVKKEITNREKNND